MPGNSIGYAFRFTSFGESHGPTVGGIIDGCPAGLQLDFAFIRDELKRRHPVYPGSTGRNEPDEIEWLSGLQDGVTLGTPVAFQVRNIDNRSQDYTDKEDYFRPSHADYTYHAKYGIVARQGGGRASGRETVARVIAGAVAKQYLRKFKVEVDGFVSQIGGLVLPDFPELLHSGSKDPSSQIKLTDPAKEPEILEMIDNAKNSGDTLGGAITCRILNIGAGLGEPVFDKLQADLAKAMLSIGSAKGFEYGLGFRSAFLPGSEYNDQMEFRDGKVRFLTNHDGGIQGGISNGEPIWFRVGFKPVPSLRQPQKVVNSSGETKTVTIKGRHDTCHIPRLVVVVEAMASLVIADHLLRSIS